MATISDRMMELLKDLSRTGGYTDRELSFLRTRLRALAYEVAAVESSLPGCLEQCEADYRRQIEQDDEARGRTLFSAGVRSEWMRGYLVGRAGAYHCAGQMVRAQLGLESEVTGT